jgi:hypothetical protein
MEKKTNSKKFATKKELAKHKIEVERMIKRSMKDIKKWDVKQDNALMKKEPKKLGRPKKT